MSSLAMADVSARPSHKDSGTVAIRLELLEPEPHHGTALDGAWWPRSTSLGAELPVLVSRLRRTGIRITRAAYHPAAWDPAPSMVDVAGRAVRLSWFRNMDAHLINLRGSNGERIDLLVVPPETAQTTAAQAMMLAVAARNRLSATAVLAAAESADVRDPAAQPSAARSADADTNAWESEGGSSPR